MRVGLYLSGMSLAFGFTLMAAPSSAAPMITAVGTDVSTSPFSFSYLGSTFTISKGDGFGSLISVSTAGSAAVRTVFGSPSTDFTDRGVPLYDANTLGGYGSFPVTTPVGASNGANFLGLRVTSAGQSFYGFLYTTNANVNSYGFESLANTGITATTTVPAAVPEPATWALMILGFGAIGYAMRRGQRETAKVRFA